MKNTKSINEIVFYTKIVSLMLIFLLNLSNLSHIASTYMTATAEIGLEVSKVCDTEKQ